MTAPSGTTKTTTEGIAIIMPYRFTILSEDERSCGTCLRQVLASCRPQEFNDTEETTVAADFGHVFGDQRRSTWMKSSKTQTFSISSADLWSQYEQILFDGVNPEPTSRPWHSYEVLRTRGGGHCFGTYRSALKDDKEDKKFLLMLGTVMEQEIIRLSGTGRKAFTRRLRDTFEEAWRRDLTCGRSTQCILVRHIRDFTKQFERVAQPDCTVLQLCLLLLSVMKKFTAHHRTINGLYDMVLEFCAGLAKELSVPQEQQEVGN